MLYISCKALKVVGVGLYSVVLSLELTGPTIRLVVGFALIIALVGQSGGSSLALNFRHGERCTSTSFAHTGRKRVPMAWRHLQRWLEDLRDHAQKNKSCFDWKGMAVGNPF